MDLILILALVTFALVVGFLLWNRASVKQQQTPGGSLSGIGGPNDPMAGTTEGMRHPDEMRADLDRAAVDKQAVHPGKSSDLPRQFAE